MAKKKLPVLKKVKKNVPLPLPPQSEPSSKAASVTSPFDHRAEYHLIAIGDAQQVLQLYASSAKELEAKAQEELKPLLSCSPLVVYVFKGHRLQVAKNTLIVSCNAEGDAIQLINPDTSVMEVPEDGVVIGSVRQDVSVELEQLETQAEGMLEAAGEGVEDPGMDWG